MGDDAPVFRGVRDAGGPIVNTGVPCMGSLSELSAEPSGMERADEFLAEGVDRAAWWGTAG
jgi:hypothetical protein